MRPLFVSSAVILSAAHLAAQTTPHSHDEPLQLENVVITASPYARNQTELAQPTSVLAGRELLLQPASSPGELLAEQPGVASTYFGPGASRPVIRGLGGDRVRILTGGVGVIDASVISPDHAVSLDPLLIERVEIVRGPATLLHGGNAVGGVVNLIDHRIHTTPPGETLNARVEARASSVSDESSGGAVIEGGAGTFAWHLDGYRRRAGDTQIPGFAESARRRAAEAAEAAERGEAPPTEIVGHIPNTALSADGGAFGFSLFGERGFFGASWSGHNALYGIPAGAHHANESGHDDAEDPALAPALEGVRIDLRQRRLDLQGELKWSFGFFHTTRFKLGAARYRHVEIEDEQPGTVFRNRGYDARFELLHKPLRSFEGALGWQGTRSQFEAEGADAFLPPSRTQTNALFIFEEIDLGSLAWQVGARAEHQAIHLRDDSDHGRDETALSLSAGLVWTPHEAWSLGISLARAERPPNVQELFANGPHAGTGAFEIGDPNLDVETATSLDLTLRKRTGWITGSLTLFANHFDGYIHEQPTGQLAVTHHDHFHFVAPDDSHAGEGLPVYRFVQRDARFHGAELEAIFHLHPGEQQQLDLVLAADVVRGRDTADRTNLPRITPPRLKAALVWNRRGWSLGAGAHWVARQDRIAILETATAGYTLLSAHAAYRMSLGHAVCDLFVRGSNLGDAEARVHTSFLKEVAPLPGRNITAGLRLSF